MDLTAYLRQYPKLAVAFSGGVDSSFLLYSAIQAGIDVKAYFVKSDFQPSFEMEDALKMAEGLGASLTVIPVDVLAHPEVTENPDDRCYYCKNAVFTAIKEHMNRDGMTVLADGTNASDDASDRPGMKALKELRVISPLRDCGLTKSQIREKSRKAGLFTWDKPAYACLATRIPTGEMITKARLDRTERAEAYLFSLGFSDFRIRQVGDMARIQLPEGQLELLLRHRKDILSRLEPDYSAVLLDLEVR